MQKLLRFTALVLVVVMSLLIFVGCGEEKEGSSVNIGYISGNYQMIIDSVDEINCDYLLVYRSTSGFSEIDAYVDLLEKLSTSSTATFQICPDTLNVTDKNQKIILLGNTIYSESEKAVSIMEQLRSDNYYDYLLYGFENTLSVSWMSKYGREDAFDYILSTLLNSDFGSVFTPDYSYMYLSDRSDTPVVTVDDINIIQYSVVIPGSPSYLERTVAEKLVRVIEEATDIEVPLVTDAVEESRYEILIGNTNRGETYVTQFFSTKRFVIAQYGTKLILRGGQIEATADAVAQFSTMVENASITAKPLHIKTNYTKTGSLTSLGGSNFDGYNLVFSDEFNEAEMNTDRWYLEDGAIMNYDDSALMTFKPDKVTADGHNMVIRTELNDNYVSGHVTSEKSFSFKYGYVEVRASVRATPGFWAKLVLTNQNDKNETVSQIDVFNSYASNDTIFASAGVLEADTYYSDYLKLNEPSYEAYRSGTFEYGKLLNGEEYHTYGVEWTPEYLRFFIDGVSYGTVNVSGNKYKDLKTELYLDFLCGVNLTEQTAIDENAAWPIDLCIDWIRVYQKDGSTFTDRTQLPAPTPETKPEENPNTKK